MDEYPAIGDQAGQPILAIPLASPPHRGLVTFEPGGDGAGTFPRSDGQHNLGSLHLKPGQGTTVRGGIQSIPVPPSHRQFLWPAPTHEVTPLLARATHQHSRYLEFIAGFVSGDTRLL